MTTAALPSPTHAPQAADASAQAARDYARVERAIAWLAAHWREQPGLEEIAAAVHLSPYHFQRLFGRWAGVSPTQFLRYLTVEHAKRALDEQASVLDAALDVGLSGPGRLHDLFVTLEAVSPGEYKRRGDGLDIAWGLADGPFGESLIAATERGLCGLSFVGAAGHGEALARLDARWPGARLRRDDAAAEALARAAFARAEGRAPQTLRLLVRGTNFQIKVWSALLATPPGALLRYGDLARAVGAPAAARAVGAAVGANPIAYLIPCHRVIGAATGLFETRYRWGAPRKLALIGFEAARAEAAAAGALPA